MPCRTTDSTFSVTKNKDHRVKKGQTTAAKSSVHRERIGQCILAKTRAAPPLKLAISVLYYAHTVVRCCRPTKIASPYRLVNLTERALGFVLRAAQFFPPVVRVTVLFAGWGNFGGWRGWRLGFFDYSGMG